MTETRGSVIWARTPSGQTEAARDAPGLGGARRELLLRLEGREREHLLLSSIAGLERQDLAALESMGLVVRVPGSADTRAAGTDCTGVAVDAAGASGGDAVACGDRDASVQNQVKAPPGGGLHARAGSLAGATAGGAERASPASADGPLAMADAASPDQLAADISALISRYLGLRGFALSLAVEKASTAQELRAVAGRVVQQILERHGEAAAEAARATLHLP